MGVGARLARAVRELEEEGCFVAVERERHTPAESRDYVVYLDAESLEEPRSLVVPSTHGTHPYRVYCLEPGRSYVRAMYTRSARGAVHVLSIDECTVREGGMVCRPIADVTLSPGVKPLDREDVARLAASMARRRWE